LYEQHGGGKLLRDGKNFYRIGVREPANVEKILDSEGQLAGLRLKMKPEIEAGLADGATIRQQARATYLAICLGMAGEAGRSGKIPEAAGYSVLQVPWARR